MDGLPEFTPFELLNTGGDPRILLLCDHASNAVPPQYHRLGLPATAFERHIAYDVGARGVTQALSEMLDAPAVFSCFSRLLIDPNRGEDDPTLIMRISDGSIVPGNRHVDEAERELRLNRYYRPYHAAIEAAIHRAEATLGHGPAIVSIHSFTKQLVGRPLRPWHVTLLFEDDPRSAHAIAQALSTDPELCVGENVPYRGGMEGECLYQHAVPRDLPHTLIELRNDLIETAEDQRSWAERLAPVLAEVFGVVHRAQKKTAS